MSHPKPRTLYRRLVADQSLAVPKRIAALSKLERPSSYYLQKLMRDEPGMPSSLLFAITEAYELSEARRVLRRKKLDNPNKKPGLLELK